MISSRQIHETLLDCFYPEATDPLAIVETPVSGVKVEGIMHNYIFDGNRVEKHRDQINDWLDQLPEEFNEKTGGGWSFLQACVDRNGDQWGEHMNMEELFALGIAIGRVSFLLPREMWKALPGGMPYLVIREKANV